LRWFLPADITERNRTQPSKTGKRLRLAKQSNAQLDTMRKFQPSNEPRNWRRNEQQGAKGKIRRKFTQSKTKLAQFETNSGLS